MKKKGLIISTVVMVVVLIAALTTTTFAWFSTQATASVQDIGMEVSAASTVKIGLRSNDAAGNSETEYRSGTGLTYAKAGGTWSNGTNMMGSSIQFANALSLNVLAGVGTSTTQAGTKMDDALKANANITSDYYRGAGTVLASLDLTEAKVNNTSATDEGTPSNNGSDVIDLNMGILATNAEIKTTICKITIEIPTGQLYVGMIAALRLEIKVGEKTYGHIATAGDIFGTINYDTQVATAENVITSESAAGLFVFYFKIHDNSATASKTIQPFSIRAFINGYDPDCNNSATGTGATIKLEFDGWKDGQTAATVDPTNGAKWQELTLSQEVTD